MSEFMYHVVDKNEFYKKLQDYYHLKPAKKPYPKEKMESVIQEILTAKNKQHKTKNRREYHLLKTYEVLTIGDTSYLTKKSMKEEPTGEFLVCYEELYDRIYDNHINKTFHGGRVKMEKEFKSKLQIPRPALEIFLSCCKKCSDKKSSIHRPVAPTILSKSFCQRGQVDLIDLQSMPDGNFKWVLYYQDHSTKFTILRPLHTHNSKEVAMQLLNIILLIGAPKILQSNLGREYAAKLILELRDMWSQPIIVDGPSNPENEVENTNIEMKNMLINWMEENNNKQWSVGLNFIQWKRNSSYQKSLDRTPYKALFGIEPQLGLTTSKVKLTAAQNMKSEEDLENFVSGMDSSSSALIKEITKEESNQNCSMEENYDYYPDTLDNIKIEINIDNYEAIICCLCYTNMERREKQCEKCCNDFHAACMQTSTSEMKSLLCLRCNNKRIVEERWEMNQKKIKIEPR